MKNSGKINIKIHRILNKTLPLEPLSEIYKLYLNAMGAT